MSNIFQQVSDLNVAFGNFKGNPERPDWDKLKSQAENILDEYNELMDDGIDAKNMTEVRDAICDILTFTLGLGHLAGLPVNDDMLAVHISNMSKFCADEEQLQSTVDKYQRLGVETYVDGVFPMKRVKSAKAQQDIHGNNYPKGKMLKSVAFKEPVFAPILL